MRTLHFIFLLIFTFHFNVQAASLHVPLSPEIIQALVDNYNGLSNEEKWTTIRSTLEKNDPAFLTTHEKKLKEIKWPELKYEKEKITFVQESEKVTIEVDDENTAVINGRKVIIQNGKYGNAFDSIVNVFETPKTTFMSFLINDAHALGPLAVIIIALAAVAIWAFVISPAISVVKAATLKVQCYEMLSELGAENIKSVSQSDAEAIRSKVTDIIAKSENGLASANCRENPAACRDTERALDCYRRVLDQVNEIHPSVNNSGRSEESFLDRWTPSFMRSRPSGSRTNAQ